MCVRFESFGTFLYVFMSTVKVMGKCTSRNLFFQQRASYYTLFLACLGLARGSIKHKLASFAFYHECRSLIGYVTRYLIVLLRMLISE